MEPLSPQAPATPIATVLVLNDLRSVIAPLRQVLSLSLAEARRLDRQVRLAGSAVVFRGTSEAAWPLDAALRAVGLTTSVNRLVPHPLEAP